MQKLFSESLCVKHQTCPLDYFPFWAKQSLTLSSAFAEAWWNIIEQAEAFAAH